MTKNKFKKLPNFKVFTVLYDKKGEIENLSEMEKEMKLYYFEDVVHRGIEGGKFWVDYMLQKRDEPELNP